MRQLLITSLVAVGLVAHAPGQSLRASDTERWYKGQTHMHTLWSDGDAAPELAMKQYKDYKFDFVVMTDHNVIPNIERWFPVDSPSEKRLTTERVEQLKSLFGADSVVLREENGKKEMRLKTIDELKAMFDEPGKFLVALGEEVTSRVHINGLNLRERIAPTPPSSDPAYVMKKVVSEVAEQSQRFGVPMMAHINHPNFSEGVTPGDFVEANTAHYFEVYNGHGSVHNWGNPKKHMYSTDKIWDIVLALRLIKDRGDILYGVGTDDAHDYFHRGAGGSIPNRGYTMVLAKALEPNALVEGILAGRFYASCGVHLDSIEADEKQYVVDIQAEPGVTYTTQFIGTRKGFDQTTQPILGEDGKPLPNGALSYSDDIGVVLSETTADPAVYTFQGDEIYVRAKVISSKVMAEPFKEGDVAAAWCQPIVR